ncbi:MAG: hypothetical protein HKP27_16695 [Myxococcales bacterium]|nr:hypothetical protein [Myxococcales bacterium]
MRAVYLRGWNLALSISIVLMSVLLGLMLFGAGAERVRELRASLEQIERRADRWAEVERTTPELTAEELTREKSRWSSFVRRFSHAANEPEQIVLVANHLGSSAVRNLHVEPLSKGAVPVESVAFESPSGTERIELREAFLRTRFETSYPGLHSLLSDLVAEDTPARIDRFEAKQTDSGLVVTLEIAWFIRGDNAS